MTVARILYRAATVAVATVALAAPAGIAFADVQPPPNGTPPSQFATTDTGCLGQLRSMIASGQLAGVVLPDGFVIPSGFDGTFNPRRPLRNSPGSAVPRGTRHHRPDRVLCTVRAARRVSGHPGHQGVLNGVGSAESRRGGPRCICRSGSASNCTTRFNPLPASTTTSAGAARARRQFREGTPLPAPGLRNEVTDARRREISRGCDTGWPRGCAGRRARASQRTG